MGCIMSCFARLLGIPPIFIHSLPRDKCGSINELRSLLSSGVSPNTRLTSRVFGHPNRGEVPAHWAAAWGNTEAIKVLAEYGADLTLRAEEDDRHSIVGSAMYGFSQGWHEGNTEMLKYLASNVKGIKDSIIHEAAGGGFTQILKVLLDAGVSPDFRLPFHDLEHPYKQYIDGSQLGETPAHWAAGGCNLDALKLLVQYGADLTAERDDGKSVLWFAEMGQKYHPHGNVNVLRFIRENFELRSIQSASPRNIPPQGYQCPLSVNGVMLQSSPIVNQPPNAMISTGQQYSPISTSSGFRHQQTTSYQYSPAVPISGYEHSPTSSRKHTSQQSTMTSGQQFPPQNSTMPPHGYQHTYSKDASTVPTFNQHQNSTLASTENQHAQPQNSTMNHLEYQSGQSQMMTSTEQQRPPPQNVIPADYEWRPPPSYAPPKYNQC